MDKYDNYYEDNNTIVTSEPKADGYRDVWMMEFTIERHEADPDTKFVVDLVNQLQGDLNDCRENFVRAMREIGNLRDAADWVLHATIHGISKDGGVASQTEEEEAIQALVAAVMRTGNIDDENEKLE